MANKSERKRKIVIEECVVVFGVLIAGFALQFFTGHFDSRFLAFPVNLIFITVLLLILFMKRGAPLSRMASGSLSVILLTAITLATLWMGLVPGNNVKVSWPFVLLYLLLLINLISVISVKIKSLSIRSIPFMLNHVGLLIILLAAGPGSADKARYFMQVGEGNTEWRCEELKELPLAVELIDFKMDEYPPKLAVIDINSGEALPKGEGLFFEALPNAHEKIGEWILTVDTILYKPRYAPAAFVSASSVNGEIVAQGWVSCGNFFQKFKLLSLTDSLSVAMTFPEPQSFKSQVKVYTKDQRVREGEIRVNHPLRVGSWMIYQHSYDTQRGRDSEWSIFELIYDPWVIISYIGYALLMIGAVTLFWKGGER